VEIIYSGIDESCITAGWFGFKKFVVTNSSTKELVQNGKIEAVFIR
jgi:hypothetical protein